MTLHNSKTISFIRFTALLMAMSFLSGCDLVKVINIKNSGPSPCKAQLVVGDLAHKKIEVIRQGKVQFVSWRKDDRTVQVVTECPPNPSTKIRFPEPKFLPSEIEIEAESIK